MPYTPDRQKSAKVGVGLTFVGLLTLLYGTALLYGVNIILVPAGGHFVGGLLLTIFGLLLTISAILIFIVPAIHAYASEVLD